MSAKQLSVGLLLAGLALLTVMGNLALAQNSYLEGWNSAGAGVNGWTATESGLSHVTTGGVGNTGYIRGTGSGSTSNLAGAKITSGGATGDVNGTYGDTIVVSVDVKIFASASDAILNASGWRVESSGFGWTKTNLFDVPDIDLSDWGTLTTSVDTTMNDTAAVAAGWSQSFGSGTFANMWTNVNFWDVFDGVATTTASGREVGLDNFSIVPEPSSLALLGLGGLMMLGRRRRR